MTADSTPPHSLLGRHAAAHRCSMCDATRRQNGQLNIVGRPCDICGGRGYDYIGRPCRHCAAGNQPSVNDGAS